MLSLDDARWTDLHHAYGSAHDIPNLLRLAALLPDASPREAEPYFSLWSSLCHQGDVYTASYAAVPHLVRIVETNPERYEWTLLSLVERIESARLAGRGPDLPIDISEAYFQALKRIPQIGAKLLAGGPSEIQCRIILGVCAAAAGYARLGDAIEELDPEIVERLLNGWIFGKFE